MLFLVAVGQVRHHYRFVHVHNMPDFLVFTALVPKLFGVRIILDIEDTMPEAYATKFGLPLTHPLVRLICLQELISGKFADLLITTHELHKEALIAHGHPSDKIGIIMNVGDEKIFSRLAPRDPAADSRTLTLAYHGTIAHRLGIDLILRALADARRDCPGLRLLLLGDGEYLPTVKRLIVELDLEGVVTLGGWVPVEHLPGRLAVADVGVVGNRGYTELLRNWMLPVKMLEYAAMEIPTIAPRLRAIAHYFDEGAALLYQPDDVADLARCMRAAYDSRARLATLREGLQRFNLRFNWTVMERRYFDMIAAMELPHGTR